MSDVSSRLNDIKLKSASAASSVNRSPSQVSLIAVSKTFDEKDIIPALEDGHRIFGENRVQEAQNKWPGLKNSYPDIELHLIGPLQSNKAGDAVALFDVIETIDRDKIASAIAKEMTKQGRKPSLYVQVNTGNEAQKAGISPTETTDFLIRCKQVHGLEINGLMCIPPFDENPGPHFALLRKLAIENGLPFLSMGMSSDFQTAIEMGATHIRVGSAIFGSR